MSNKYNNINIINNTIKKTGLISKIRAEYLMYILVSTNIGIQDNFPKIYTYREENERAILEMEYIEGITLYEKHKNQLINADDIKKILKLVSLFHSQTYTISVNEENIKHHYADKLYKRFLEKEQYPFNDFDIIKEKVLLCLNKYLVNNTFTISSFIHGDLWFSNILIDSKGNIKCIDPRGMINDINTSNGDILYDYAKLYQSVLGFDYAVYGESYNLDYLNKICIIFEEEVTKLNINIPMLKKITAILIAGSIYFLDSFEKKKRVWNLLKQILNEITLE
jgi:predicted unusual protein kinase regulating ubiquinone biosynthesis (AarF/ABC1/UbiB family)